MRDADYIIVGAGSASCVLASEICRRQLGRVLMIETGRDPISKHLKVPSEYPLAFQGQHAWQHATVPQPRLAHRRISMPAGKTLGGSSAINAMIYLRGHPTDFDRWMPSAGSDWERAKVALAFDALENTIGLNTIGLNTIGLNDSVASDLHPALSMFLMKAASIQGLPQQRSFLEPSLGLGRYLRCQANGRRRSAWNIWMKSHELLEREDAQLVV